MAELPKPTCRLCTIPVNISAGVFAEMEKPVLKRTWKWKEPSVAIPKKSELGLSS